MKFPENYEVTLNRPGSDPVVILTDEPLIVRDPYEHEGFIWLVTAVAFYRASEPEAA